MSEQQPDRHDRRHALRVPVSIPVELKHGLGFSLHSCSDLSVGGAFFDRSIPYPIGSRVTVLFTVPGDAQSIVCDGEVVNVPDSTSFGMGVRFTNLKEADRHRLEAFTRELEGFSPS